MNARGMSSHRSNGGGGARPARTFAWAWTVALVLVALTQSSCAWSGSVPSEPGSRPPKYRMSWFRGIDDQLRDAAWTLKYYQEQRAAAPSRRPLLKPWAKTKADWDGDMREQQEVLKNLLARDTNKTPGGVQTGKGQGSNKEVMELANSFDNLRLFVELGRKELEKKRDDVAAAQKYYWAYAKAVEMMHDMHVEFADRCTSVYRPAIRGLSRRARLLREQTLGDAEALSSERQRATLLKLAERQEQMRGQLLRSLPVLEKQQEWAAKRVPSLREQIIVARRAYETVELAVDFAATLGGISAAFHDLEAELPELIVFDVPMAELTAPGIEP